MELYVERLVSRFSLDKVFTVVLGILAIVVFVRVLKKLLGRYVKEKNSWYKTKKAVNILGYFMATVFILITYSDRIPGISVVIGIVGAGLAFTLQEVILSIAGWIAVLVGDMYKTGDRVLLGGISGDVIDLGITKTTVMEIGQWVNGDLYSGRIVKVSNSAVFKEPIYNYSADFPFVWDEVRVPIKYGSDYREARRIIQESGEKIVGDYCEEARNHWELMVRKFLIEDASVKPTVTLEANDNWMEYTLRYVVDYKKRRTTKDMLFTEIVEGIEASEQNIELASATFDIVGTPEIDVKLKEARSKKY